MAQVATQPPRVTPWKVTAATLLPLIILGGFLLLLAQRPPTTPPPTDSSSAVVAPKPAVLPVVLATDESPLAVVNDTPIDADALAEALAIDRAMVHLLGAEGPAAEVPADGQAVLERLVNGLLVAQAAQQTGFALDDGQLDAALANLLAGAGQDNAALERALAAENVSQADFRAAFAQLLLVDQFTRQEAAAQGVEASRYLQSLQTQARISFGPGVEVLDAAPSEEVAVQPAVQQAEQPAVQPAVQATEQSAELAAPEALAENQSALLVSPTPEWQLLPFVADPAFATPKEGNAPAENAPSLTGSSSVGSVEQIVTGTATGNFVPDFNAVLAKGEGEVTLADLKGKPTLLSFWTTWCPYCLRQTPLLVEAYSRWAEAGVNFVGVNVGEANAQVLPYLETHAITYPIGLDESGEIAAAYAVRGFPTTYFLDAEGRVVARHVGQLSAEDIDSYLNQITQNP